VHDVPEIITYTFQLPDGRNWSASVNVSRQTRKRSGRTVSPIPLDPPPPPPDWTRLEYQRCANCPLPDSCERCPPAVDAAPILEQFASLPSYTRVTVTVTAPNRIYVRETDTQAGLMALLGLVMSTSGCPILARLRSQAFFHLPFASLDETIYRTVGDYLIKQFYILKEGGKPDFELAGLSALYQDLAVLNEAFFHRIQAAESKDSNANAIVALRSISDIVSMTIDESLASLRDAMENGTV